MGKQPGLLRALSRRRYAGKESRTSHRATFESVSKRHSSDGGVVYDAPSFGIINGSYERPIFASDAPLLSRANGELAPAGVPLICSSFWRTCERAARSSRCFASSVI